MSKMCPKCRRITDDYVNFCPECGSPVEYIRETISVSALTENTSEQAINPAPELAEKTSEQAINSAPEASSLLDKSGEEAKAAEADSAAEAAQILSEPVSEVDTVSVEPVSITNAAEPESTAQITASEPAAQATRKDDFLIYKTQPELRPKDYEQRIQPDQGQYGQAQPNQGQYGQNQPNQSQYYVNNNMGNNNAPLPGNEDGKGAADTSMVLGIISLVASLFGLGAVIGIGCGIAGLIMSSKSKKTGYKSSSQNAGFICSILGVCLGSLVFIACVCFMVIGATV